MLFRSAIRIFLPSALQVGHTTDRRTIHRGAPPPLPSPQDAGAIVLVSNGPGELSTWVRPLARRLHDELPLRPLQADAPQALHLVLVPCPNATGQEARVARDWGTLAVRDVAMRFVGEQSTLVSGLKLAEAAAAPAGDAVPPATAVREGKPLSFAGVDALY